MNTISEVTNRHLAFQQTQLLPLLTEEMIRRLRGATAPCDVQPRSGSSSDKTTRHLPFKQTQLLPLLNPEVKAGKGGARRAPAPACKTRFVSQVFAAMFKLTACWATFEAWGVRPRG